MLKTVASPVRVPFLSLDASLQHLLTSHIGNSMPSGCGGSFLESGSCYGVISDGMCEVRDHEHSVWNSVKSILIYSRRYTG